MTGKEHLTKLILEPKALQITCSLKVYSLLFLVKLAWKEEVSCFLKLNELLESMQVTPHSHST